jgi:hypothetical protein
LGAVQGLNVFLVYLLARTVLRDVPRERGVSALAGLVAAAGPCAVSLLGTTFIDNLVSILVVAAFLAVVQVAEQPESGSGSRLTLAGLLAGAAVGLKLTFATYLVGLSVAVLALAFRIRSLRVALCFATGSVVGGVSTGGYWATEMWRRFHNPIFPFANDVFQSPYLPSVALSDPRWVARSWTEFLSVPFDMALGLTSGLQEVEFRDVRYAILLMLTVTMAGAALRRPRRVLLPAGALVVVLGWLASYLAWMRVFHYYRYFAAGEFLAPVAILGVLRLLDMRRLCVVWLAAGVVIVASTKTASWGRMRWRDGPLRVNVPLTPVGKPAVVIVDGYGNSVALPFFPPGTRFFGLHNGAAFDLMVARELERHKGPVFRLRPQSGAPTPLRRFGLEDGGQCETLRTGGRGRLSLCPLVRVSPGSAP